MMIDTAPLRAALNAALGQPVEVLPADMAQLLDAIDDGNAAQRELRQGSAAAGAVA